MAKKRQAVDEQDKWNVAALYPDMKAWEADYQATQGNSAFPRWPALAVERGQLGLGAEHVKKALECLLELQRRLEKLYTYAHLRHDEDIADDQHKAAYKQVTNLLHDFSRESAWFEPELLALPQERIDEYLKASQLLPYQFHLEKIVRMKAHTLTPDQEELLAMASRALQAPHKAFSALNDADFKFGVVVDSGGVERELTHASYGLFIRDQDRTLRKNSFKRLHEKYAEYEQTLCELINGQVESHLFEARARRYSSCLESALYPKNVDTSVYHALIQAVRNNLDALHDYTALRKELLGLDELHLYDLYVPLTRNMEIKIPYREAEELVVASVAPLGSHYQNVLRSGLQEQRWVDRFENENKRSGAYSSGCFDSAPYILMNYKGVLRDVSTLSHEVGHSMHSYLSRKTQPFQYASYPIFVAEVASTFNEQLLFDLMLDRLQTEEERFFLINEKLEEIRQTLFRQTLFAEFELFIHTTVENNTPITPIVLRKCFADLYRTYYGDGLVVDAEIEHEWSRIPHFYYNFYVYQYATGISAAIALAQKVKEGGESARNAYLAFLSGGCSQYPIDLLRMAGVDMRSPEPVEQAIVKFRQLLAQLRSLAVRNVKC